MPAYSYIESNGLILPDTADLKDAVEAEFREAFGDDLILLPESPEGVLVAVETEARDAVLRNNAELANQINPEAAGGVFLDALCAFTGLARRPAESSLVKAQLAGVPETIIPEGSRAATTAGDVFVLRQNLALGGDGQGEAWFYSEAADAIPAPAGSLTRIIDQALGWEGIDNAEPAGLGRPVESDEQLRKRRRDTLFLQGVALPGAIVSGVLDVPGVRSVVFRENVFDEEQIIDGATIPAHSIYVIVDGGTDEDVAQAIFQKKSLGCGLKGETEAQVKCPESGQSYSIRFDRPTLVEIRARATVRVMGSAALDYTTIVRQAVMDYALDKLPGLRGLATGAAVSPFEMAMAVGLVEPAIFVIKMEVGPAGAADLSTDTMTLAIREKALITPERISVVVNG
jgi:uncharacterized phage protein gp47/JayE